MAPSRCTPTRFDEAIALPTDSRPRIARNTQLILQDETGITHVVDPLGGSYYIEALTDDLATKAWALIDEVEALGGMTKAVESGMPKLQIEEAAARRQARVDRGEDVVVGVNKYPLDDGSTGRRPRHRQHHGARGQIGRLEEVRAERDDAACKAALEALTEGAAGDGNLLDWPSKPPAPAPRSAKSPTPWRTCSAATAPRPVRHLGRLWRRLQGRRGLRRDPVATSRPSPARRAAARACSSPRWARTATIAAPR